MKLSTHILAQAVVEAAQERELPLSAAEEFEKLFGKGVHRHVPMSTQEGQSMNRTRE